jgi:hypothetical protein
MAAEKFFFLGHPKFLETEKSGYGISLQCQLKVALSIPAPFKAGASGRSKTWYIIWLRV